MMSSYAKGCLLRPTSSLWFNACHKVVNVCSEIYLLMWNCSTSFLLSSWRVFLVFFLCSREDSINSCHRIVDFEYSVIMRIPKRSFTTYLTFLSWVLFAALAWCFFQLTVSENDYSSLSFILWSVSHNKTELVICYLFLTIRKIRLVSLYLSGLHLPPSSPKIYYSSWKEQFVSLKSEDRQGD